MQCQASSACIPVSRRRAAAAAVLLPLFPLRSRAAEVTTVESDSPGFGAAVAQAGDLVLVAYRGELLDGTTFDSTLGGYITRSSESSASVVPAAAVPRAVSLRPGDVQPGICDGLRQALLGMRVGGTRTVSVPPSLGFGSTTVLAPVAPVPANSTLRYTVTLLRLSRSGPDALFAGISQCGVGGAGAQSAGCDNVTPRE